MTITIHRSEHAATVATGPADLVLPFAIPMAAVARTTRAPELVTPGATSSARAARNRRRASANRRRAAA